MENKAMRVFVRTACKEDAPDLIELAEQLGYPTQPGEIAKRLEHLREREDHQVFVAVEEDRGLVGWVHVIGAYHLVFGPSAELGGLVVRDGWRERGIGRLLLERAEDWAGVHGYGVMRVNSNTARQDVPGFYEHLGYQRIKTQNVFYKSLI
jgi:GNAT superfamily N-acetyltransferase